MQQTQPAPQLSPEAQELLAQLRDIREPAPVGWWPPAPGWWLLAFVLLACAAGLFLWLRRKRQQRLRQRYRTEAVRLLQLLDTGDRAAPQEINEILKRVAVTSYGRTNCGNLTGRAWLDFLQAAAPESPCPEEAQRVLLEHLYREDAADSSANRALRDYAVQWVQLHNKTFPAPSAPKTTEATGV